MRAASSAGSTSGHFPLYVWQLNNHHTHHPSSPPQTRCPVHGIPLLPFIPHASPALAFGRTDQHHLALWSLVDFQSSRSQFKPKGLTRRASSDLSPYLLMFHLSPQSQKAHPCGALCGLSACPTFVPSPGSAASHVGGQLSSLAARPSPEVALLMDNPEVFIHSWINSSIQHFLKN